MFQMSRAVAVKITGKGASYRGREGQTRFAMLRVLKLGEIGDPQRRNNAMTQTSVHRDS